MRPSRTLLGLIFGAVAAPAFAGDRAGSSDDSCALVLHSSKVITLDEREGGAGAYLDDAYVIVRDGLIERVVPAAEYEPVEGARVRELGELWLMPGLIDLHSHIGGTFDINDTVYQANPGLRVSTAVRPQNPAISMALAAGVTTVLFIPGSGTTVGGQGILLKTSPAGYERMRLRDPGSLKVAQADNPKRWGYRMNRIMLNWQIREVCRRGVAYAKRWEAYEDGTGDQPHVDPQFEVFRALVANEAQISTHTQVLQVVLASIQIMTVELGLPMYIDHGSFDGYKVAHIAEREGVYAILGPRNFSSENKGRGIDHDGRFEGIAAGYQRNGHSAIGFNTDAPVIPAEELALQAGMACRFGMTDWSLESVRGLTIVPARAAGIEGRVGSLEPGKHADLIAIEGAPSDPRSAVRFVWVEGDLVYDSETERRLF